MAHIGEFNINTNGTYTTLAELIPELELMAGTTYTLQVRGNLLIQVTDKTPQSGGFIIKDLTPFAYKHEDGYELYVKTCEEGCIINIAE